VQWATTPSSSLTSRPPACHPTRDSAPRTPGFIDDRAQLLTTGERERIEAYHRRLLEALDIHLQVTILAQPAADIDTLAVKLFEESGLGKTTRAARGVLLLVDPQGKQVRLEIGYDLEGIFTDLLVSRVEREQMVPFFQAGRVGPGLEATVELLVAEALQQPEGTNAGKPRLSHLSGGGGARTGVAIGSGAPAGSAVVDPGRFVPGADPLATLQVYREVLRQRVKDPDLAIYTPQSREFFRKWLVTDAQQANELKSLIKVLDSAEVRSSELYAVVRTDPEARTSAPYLLRRGELGWQLDFVTMSQVIGFNHLNQWRFRTLNHPYMFAFADWTFDQAGFPKE
jgi:uncharacterized protein